MSEVDLEWCPCGKRLTGSTTSKNCTFSLGLGSESAPPPSSLFAAGWEKSSLYCSTDCFLADIMVATGSCSGNVSAPPATLQIHRGPPVGAKRRFSSDSQAAAVPPSPALSAAASEKCPSPLFLSSSPPTSLPSDFSLGSFLNRPNHQHHSKKINAAASNVNLYY